MGRGWKMLLITDMQNLLILENNLGIFFFLFFSFWKRVWTLFFCFYISYFVLSSFKIMFYKYMHYIYFSSGIYLFIIIIFVLGINVFYVDIKMCSLPPFFAHSFQNKSHFTFHFRLSRVMDKPNVLLLALSTLLEIIL